MTARPAAGATPAHHFSEELLLDYAAGSLAEPLALLVATHLSLCPPCRAAVAEGEALGGALLENLAPVPLAADALEKTLARLDREDSAAPRRETAPALPPPLRDYLGGDLEDLAWQPLAPGVALAPLGPLAGGAAAWPPGVEVGLARLAPGAVAPRHTHAGIEATVIVQGGFADQYGQYERGDAWIVDARVTHAPAALPGEPCLCLVYLDAPLKLVGDG